MANHIRRQLREAVAAAVTGLTTTGANVFQWPAYALQDANLPALRVSATDSSSQVESIHAPALISRIVEVIVEGVAKANADLDDTLDDIAKEVESALGPGVTVSSKTVQLGYTGCEIEVSGDGEKPTGTIRMRFETTLYNLANAPDVLS
jgi:hypothetical protein